MFLEMKHILITIGAVLLVGCGKSQNSDIIPYTKKQSPTAKAPDISIHNAAREGNTQAVKQHLAAGSDVNEKDRFQRAPLHMAALLGRKEIVELLIAEGTDVNVKNKRGWIPLFSATAEGQQEVIEQLIAKGADVNAVTND